MCGEKQTYRPIEKKVEQQQKPACFGHYNERDGKCVRCYQWMLECDEAPVEEGESREGA